MNRIALWTACVGVALTCESTPAAIALGGGATLQGSYFTGAAGSFDMSYHGTYGVVGTPADMADGKAGRNFSFGGTLTQWQDTFVTSTGFLQLTATAAFTPGTVIHVASYSGAGLTGDEPYTVSLGGTTVGSSTGNAVSSDVYSVSQFSLPGPVTTLRVEFSNVCYQAGFGGFGRLYGGVSEVAVLPALGPRIPIAGSGASDGGNNAYGLLPAMAVDNSQAQGWYGTAGATLTLNLGDPTSNADTFSIGSIFVANYENVPSSYSIWASTDGGNNYAQIVGTVTMDLGDLGLLNLTSPVSGMTHLQIRNTAGFAGGLLEIMPFGMVPEPASAALLAVMTAVTLRLRRRPPGPCAIPVLHVMLWTNPHILTPQPVRDRDTRGLEHEHSQLRLPGRSDRRQAHADGQRCHALPAQHASHVAGTDAAQPRGRTEYDRDLCLLEPARAPPGRARFFRPPRSAPVL